MVRTSRRAHTRPGAPINDNWLAVLEAFPDAVTLSTAVRDATGHATDMRLQWMNAAARSGQPLPHAAVGELASHLWPQMVDNGSLHDCLRALDGAGPQSGEFIWTQQHSYRPASYDYRAVALDGDTLLWVLRDINSRFRAWSAAEELQRHLLAGPSSLHLPATTVTAPTPVPHAACSTSAEVAVPAVTTFGVYLPAPTASTIGGDWYDAFELSGGRVALSVGDVVGHDVLAAARMAQLRATVRALAWDRETPPSEVLVRVDAAVRGMQLAPMATAVYAVLDVERRRLTWANAGHPPPMLVRGDGSAHLLTGEGLVLGVAEVDRADLDVDIGRGDTLVLYTDGLVERRGEGLEVGLSRLISAAPLIASSPVDAAAEHVVTACSAAGVDPSVAAEDDVAVLLIRLS